MKRLSTFVFIISFMFAQAVRAQTAIGSGSSGSMNINDTAKKSSSSAGMMKIANTAAGAGFVAKAVAADPPQKPIWYALAAASLAMASSMGKGKSNASNIANVTDAPSMPGYSGGTEELPGAGFDSGSGYGSDAQIDALEQQIRDAGYALSADGSSMRLPNGQTVSTADIASGKAPGFSMDDGMKQEAAAIAEDAMKKASGAKVVAVGLEDGGGSGGGSAMQAAPEGGGRFDMGAYLKGLKNRDPSSVSGLSKKLGDDNIGIKSDNIFEMVSRQYKRKQSQRAFVN